MAVITTAQLRNYRATSSHVVGFDEEWFEYQGMTEQANGDVVVHLAYIDNGSKFDIEVAKQDLREPYWDK